MRVFLSTLAIFLTFGFVTTAHGADHAKITKAFEAWDVAFNKCDIEGFKPLYTADGKFIPASHKIATGPNEIAQAIGGACTAGVTAHTTEIVDSGSTGKLIWVTSKWTAKMKKDGKDVDLGGNGFYVFSNEKGGLKIRSHGWN